MKISTVMPGQLRGEGLIGFRSLDGLREQRLTDYALLKGRHYMARTSGLYGRADRQPVNLTQQLVRTLTPFVAMNAPLADVTPMRADLEFEAAVRKQVHDYNAQAMKLHEVYQDGATEAFMSGVAFFLNGIKTGGETYAAGNRRLDMGQTFTRLLDLDDVAVDPMAKTLDGARFFAYRYTISRQEAIDAIEDGVYGAAPEDYEDGILPNPHIASPAEARHILEHCTSVEGYPKRGERVDENDGEWATSGDRLDETIILWDFVLYAHGQVWICTLPGEPGQQQPFGVAGDVDKYLAMFRWRGPASGPVTRLTFLRVPFNKMPLALAQMQRDLAEIADLLANKTFRQLIRTKNVVVYDGSAENMVMAMKKAPEGGYIRGNPQAVTTIQDGGLIGDMMPGTQFFRDEWQMAVGNLALASGTGDTGKTATAFEGLMSRVQAFLDFLRSRVEQAATDNLQIHDWYLSNNPQFITQVRQTIGRAPFAMTADVTIAAAGAQLPMGMQPDYVMQGTPADFAIKTRAFSMQYTNPIVSAQQVMTALQEVIPAVLATGMDPRPPITILARKLNEPELEMLIPDPMTQILLEQKQAAAAAAAADPTGQGANRPNSADAGPAGRRLPQASRAMRPGPGQGSPRPQRTPQPQGAAA